MDTVRAVVSNFDLHAAAQPSGLFSFGVITNANIMTGQRGAAPNVPAALKGAEHHANQQPQQAHLLSALGTNNPHPEHKEIAQLPCLPFFHLGASQGGPLRG
ncbi:hypothetical protein ACJZ2D_006902 [Fusarium nematophilum]